MGTHLSLRAGSPWVPPGGLGDPGGRELNQVAEVKCLSFLIPLKGRAILPWYGSGCGMSACVVYMYLYKGAQVCLFVYVEVRG